MIFSLENKKCRNNNDEQQVCLLWGIKAPLIGWPSINRPGVQDKQQWTMDGRCIFDVRFTNSLTNVKANLLKEIQQYLTMMAFDESIFLIDPHR